MEIMMKKKMFGKAVILVLIAIAITTRKPIVYANVSQAQNDTKEVMYNDVIITALSPTIDKALNDYYKNILKEIPGYDTTSVEIINIDRPNGNRTEYFVIQLEVRPFIGPHITVGKDRLTIELQASETPKVLKFDHLEDYKLPERY